MKVIDDYLESVQERYGPAVRHAGLSAAGYAERICHTLDCIHHSVSTCDDERRSFTQYTESMSRIPIADVPAGAVWEIEVLSTLPQSSPRLYSNDDFRLANSGFAALMPVRFIGPCQVKIEPSTAAATTTYLQFRVIRRHPSQARSVGQINRGIEPIAAERAHSPLHSGIGIG